MSTRYILSMSAAVGLGALLAWWWRPAAPAAQPPAGAEIDPVSRPERSPPTPSSSKAGSRPAVRAFLNTASRPAIQNDPTAPDYDPLALVVGAGASAQAIFDAEPRDQRWALAMEKQISANARRNLGHLDYLKIGAIECRTSGCVLDVSYPSGDEAVAREVAVLIRKTGLGYATSMYDSDEKEGRRTDRVGLFFPRDLHDPARVRQWSEEERAKFMQFASDPEAARAIHFPPK